MITIIGLGFVGLTTGLGFAKKGFKTFGIDIDQERIQSLQRLEIPFHEPHLKEVLEETIDQKFFLNPPFEEAIRNSKAIFICVGSPSAEDGSADLSYIFQAIDNITEVRSHQKKVIVIKSTVPPSTLEEKIAPYVKAGSEDDRNNIVLASNPEFLREGHCWEDFIEPDRIVVGAEEEAARSILSDIYRPFDAPLHFVSFNTSEFIKYLSNTLLSTMISYSNEMSMIAHQIGHINIAQAFRILHEDKRWTGSPANMATYVYPGCGYGGYCLPKDTLAIYSLSKQKGYEPRILKANLDVNMQIQTFVADVISQKLKKDASIGILGLSFKPGSDDIRITPTKRIIAEIIDRGFSNIHAYDPISNAIFQKAYPELNINYSDSLEGLLNDVDNVAILTGWTEFNDKKKAIRQKQVFDFRYIY
jgi:UDPglucose 6-dehydrogenase